jgi:hypothetical protein
MILDLWDDADPDSWNHDGVGTGNGYPATEMQDSATSNGISAWSNLAAVHGTDR